MTNELTHLDLFSGIGGFALAAKWNGFRTIAFCDCEPYAQRVLRKHWPDVHVHGDIRQVRGELYAGVTLLTGGFPCQPFSVAGKQRGKDDNRYLWPEMCRVIREARPAWIIGENVAGIVNLALDTVCADLEAEGYEVEPVIIPACAVDAQHRRDRVWIVATNLSNSINNGSYPEERHEAESCGNKSEDWVFVRNGGLMAHAAGCRMEGNGAAWKQVTGLSTQEGLSRRSRSRRNPAIWLPEPDVGRVAHGVPNRVAKLRGLGNAIVPQVAAEIIRCIREVSR